MNRWATVSRPLARTALRSTVSRCFVIVSRRFATVSRCFVTVSRRRRAQKPNYLSRCGELPVKLPSPRSGRKSVRETDD
jgi:hypothetical protein